MYIHTYIHIYIHVYRYRGLTATFCVACVSPSSETTALRRSIRLALCSQEYGRLTKYRKMEWMWSQVCYR